VSESLKLRSNKEVLFVYINLARFIKDDLDILKKYFDVVPLQVSGVRDIPRIFNRVASTDLSYIWFEYAHSTVSVLFSKLFGKKTIIMAGDSVTFANSMKEMKELGIHERAFFKLIYLVLCPLFSIKFADYILVPSKYKQEVLLKHVPSRKVKVVYNGVSSKMFFPKGKKEDIVITVCYLSRENVVRKGLNTFIESARYLPETNFIVVGDIIDDEVYEELKSVSPLNVQFSGKVDDVEIVRYMQRSKVYVQLSMYETFGVALAESMLCECIPVVTDRGPLPEVVGDAGFYVPYGDAEATAEAIEKALNSNNGKSARERVEKLFSIERREKELVEIINEFL